LDTFDFEVFGRTGHAISCVELVPMYHGTKNDATPARRGSGPMEITHTLSRATP
jgi:hypothetical protein